MKFKQDEVTYQYLKNGNKESVVGPVTIVETDSVTVEDLIQLLSGKEAGETIKSYAEGFNLRARRDVRYELAKSVEDPMEKVTAKQVKQLIELRALNGKPITEEAARAKVMARIKADLED